MIWWTDAYQTWLMVASHLMPPFQKQRAEQMNIRGRNRSNISANHKKPHFLLSAAELLCHDLGDFLAEPDNPFLVVCEINCQ